MAPQRTTAARRPNRPRYPGHHRNRLVVKTLRLSRLLNETPKPIPINT